MNILFRELPRMATIIYLLKVVDHYKPILVRRCFMQLPKLLLKEIAEAELVPLPAIFADVVRSLFYKSSFAFALILLPLILSKYDKFTKQLFILLWPIDNTIPPLSVCQVEEYLQLSNLTLYILFSSSLG